MGREGKTRGPVFAVTTRSDRGVQRVRHARHVVFAIGYFDHPVMLGVPGEDLPHVHHYYGEPHPYYRQRVVIVGGGNSAAESALEMYRAGAHVTMVHRGPTLKSHDQVLGATRHREPHQGRIDCCAVQRVSDRDPADVGAGAGDPGRRGVGRTKRPARGSGADADASHEPASPVVRAPAPAVKKRFPPTPCIS